MLPGRSGLVVVGRWVDGVDMSTAEAELRTGYVETEEVEAVESGHPG
jgi:hypothetical protein